MKIFVTRQIPDKGIVMLREKGYEVEVSQKDGVLTKEELIAALSGKNYDAVLSLLTDKVDADVMNAAGAQCKIFANYAVGFDNIDLKTAKEKNLMVSNTPEVLTQTVAEHAMSLMLSIAHRIPEADRFTRAGKYVGWGPMLLLGSDVSGKVLGIVGLGRIGMRVAHHAVRGFGMQVLYYDVKRNEEFEAESGALYRESVDDLLAASDFVSVHAPLLESTRHIINADRLAKMKSTAYLINTSRGPLIDEAALASALKTGVIKGAALDVFENEPKIHTDLLNLENIILTPHIASATEDTRQKMSELAALNIIAALSGERPPNLLEIK